MQKKTTHQRAILSVLSQSQYMAPVCAVNKLNDSTLLVQHETGASARDIKKTNKLTRVSRHCDHKL